MNIAGLLAIIPSIYFGNVKGAISGTSVAHRILTAPYASELPSFMLAYK